MILSLLPFLRNGHICWPHDLKCCIQGVSNQRSISPHLTGINHEITHQICLTFYMTWHQTFYCFLNWVRCRKRCPVDFAFGRHAIPEKLVGDVMASYFILFRLCPKTDILYCATNVLGCSSRFWWQIKCPHYNIILSPKYQVFGKLQVESGKQDQPNASRLLQVMVKLTFILND
jgi:hypothetical protein